ncbi:MAG: hypothetical protein AAB457_00960 [Patescibacteria group bacterium]
MSGGIEDLQNAYQEAQIPMRELLETSRLTPGQIVVLGQLASAIVDGRAGQKESADVVVGRVLDKCRELGIPEILIEQFQTFGNEWADKLYPHE